jgi:hypothetical protein
MIRGTGTYVNPMSSARRGGSDGDNVDPETGVISLVLGVGVDLALDPLHGGLVFVDVVRVRIGEPGCAVAMAGKPDVVAVVLLAVPPRGNIGVDIPAGIEDRLGRPPYIS